MAESIDADRIAGIVTRLVSDQEEVVAVFLFGSVVEGTCHILSDIDLAVLFRVDLPAEAVFRRTLEIGALMEQALPRPVDVVALNTANFQLSFQVLQTGRVIFERDRDERALFTMRVLGRYYDEKPNLDYQNSVFLERLRREGLGRGYHGHRDALAEARRLSAKLKATAKRHT